MAENRFHPFRLLTRLEVRAPLLRPLTRRLAARRFDDLAPVWDRIRERDPDATRVLDAALAALGGDEALPPRRILDVGTGTGQAAFLLHERFPEAALDAVDAAPAMIAAGRAKLRGEPITFSVADGARLPFPDAAFDLAVALCVQPFYRELARVVRPAGAVLFAYSFGPATPIWFSADELRRGLERAGFEHVRSGTTGRGEWTVARRRAAS